MLHLLHWLSCASIKYVSKVDDFYQHIASCVHEQRAHGLQSIGVAIKNTVFVTFVGLVDRFKA